MFAEKLGKLLFKRIRFPFFYLILIAFPIGVASFLFMEKQSIDLISQQLEMSRSKAKTAAYKKARKELFVLRHAQSDPYFLSKELETLTFLEQEKLELKQWINHPAIAQKAPLIERVKFIESQSNHLIFQEDEIQLSKRFKETRETQKSPVQMDQQDLKKILGLIEDLPSDILPLTHRPQLIISEFSMQKKWTPLEKQIFEVNIDLFKREFLSP